ncbi:tRNA (guanosine(37)-N1)-methyltransferase TrmD, partial [Patescibacteria group bacterium]|nr:tRNA (guanosine(37)-N1)-methyltransferase TrmD [Patescibacteria group bacterium]
MLTFDIITIFPEIFDSYLKESLIARAQKKKLIKINVHNLRDWATDKHKTVDDRPFGGGLGMVLKIEPIFRAVEEIKKKFRLRQGFGGQAKIILFTPRGKQFNQKIAYQFSKLDRIIMICGRYEGVDERVAKYIADLEISIGDYDLMGGELPAMVVIETVARLIPGVLGKPQLLKERITKEKGFIEYPQYTRPPKFFPKKIKRARPKVWAVPKFLLSGHHK